MYISLDHVKNTLHFFMQDIRVWYAVAQKSFVQMIHTEQIDTSYKNFRISHQIYVKLYSQFR